MQKEELKKLMADYIKYDLGKTFEKATKEDLFLALSYSLRNFIMDRWEATKKEYEKSNVKQMYYLSSEFLMGRALGNNIINLNAQEIVKELFDEYGIDYNMIEEVEPDAGLGNGGLGRLAACFLDSLATLQLPGHGCSIRYRYGIFKQKIVDGFQIEKPDDWLEYGKVWLVKKWEETLTVAFGSKNDKENYQEVKAVPYDMPILGYKNNTVNTLRLWDAESAEKIDLDLFDKGEYLNSVKEKSLAETITYILYPNDNHIEGKELRLKQQYFFVSASIQSALKKFKLTNTDLKLIPQKLAFQLNDTHPAVAVAELMRILVDEEGMKWEEAWEVTVNTCAYTNHTILAEALEKWPVSLFKRLLPRIYEIIVKIDKNYISELKKKYSYDADMLQKMAIIGDDHIRMAWLSIVGSHSVNGVAALHTEILKHQELKDFYEIYPEKFNNKTNGVTQRRWLLQSNPELSSLITDTIKSDEWTVKLDTLKALEAYAEDKEFQKKFLQIKALKKVQLANYIKEHNGIEVDPHSIFDIQVKRLHEYKRQLLNVMHIMYLYNHIKENPSFKMHPQTFIFAAKSAPGYVRAKLIIKLINSVADMVNNDEAVNKFIKVVFLENFNVSIGQMVYPAADVSEQISTASKEASGTGNMKFALNGAVTLGTLDGANVEILEEVGEDNIFIFGLKADEIIKYEKSGEYKPLKEYKANKELKKIVDSFKNGSLSQKDKKLFKDLYFMLLEEGDRYFHLADFEEYRKAQEKVNKSFYDREKWAEMCIYNIARSGRFSSDRTIQEYADQIWNLKKVEIKL